MSETKSYKAGTANFRGDVSHMVGEVKGPTTYGSWLVVTAADYDEDGDEDGDRTRVTFAHCRTNEDGSISLPAEQSR